MAFDIASAFRPDLPPEADPSDHRPPYSFVGGHNDADSVPFAGLAEAAVTVLGRHGRDLATYNLGGSPLGHDGLRRFVASALDARAGLRCRPEEIMITSGSLQALDLVNEALLARGDTVVIEQATYGGMISRLDRMGVEYVGVDLDEDGIVPDHLESVLGGLAGRGVTPKYLYTIPTVQNPTGSVMPVDRRHRVLELARRYGVPIFEDDCYADLTWTGQRPPSIRAVDDGGGHVVYCGSFSKSIAPAIRVGYLVGDAPVIRRLLALKTDAGTGAIEQLTLAEYCPTHFDAHVEQLTANLRARCDAMLGAIEAHFGATVEVTPPRGGIFVWVTFPEGVDTTRLAEAALAAGVEFNPGAGWSADQEWGSRRMRLCFGHTPEDTIRAGVAALAGVVRAETGLAVPAGRPVS